MNDDLSQPLMEEELSYVNMSKFDEEVGHTIHVPLDYEPNSRKSSLHLNPRNHASLSNYNKIKPATLTFQDLTVSVTTSDKKQKKILNNISGFVKKGNVLCILGPSGCGKTTLLNTLCGIQQPTSGTIWYNGKQKHSSKTSKLFSSDQMGYDGNAAYIAQNVVLLSSLTVTESLKYATKLKYLPFKKNSNKSDKEIDEFINETIDYLGLNNCRSTLVGSSSLMNKSSTSSSSGQISGGQKKRLAIGIELMSQPTLLFMDEVTSGLDATSAYQVFGIINRLSQLGHSIIITLHQPSSRLFGMMKEFGYYMMILQTGRTMYFGKAIDSVQYFQTIIGYKLPSEMNPIDYYLDIVNDDYIRKKNQTSRSSQKNSLHIQNKSDLTKTMMSSLEIHNKYQQHLKGKILKDIEKINTLALKEAELDINSKYNERINGFVLLWKQCMILIKRNFRNDTRNIGTYWIRIIMYILLCFCIGSMYFKIGTSQTNEHDRVSILFFIVTFLTFLSIAGIPSFLELRDLYIRERLNNHYNALSYSIANFISSIPWIIIIALVVSIILYFMIESHGIADFNYFIIFFLNIFMTAMVAEAMVVTVSAISGGQFMIAFAVAGGLMALYIALCGFFLLPSNIPWYWIWVHYGFSFHTYSFQIFMYNDFNNFNRGEINGNWVLGLYDMDNINIKYNFIILISMMFFYRILFFLLLRFFVRAA